MSLFCLKYKIKNRWIKTDTFDEYGEEIKLVNPNPTVEVLIGRWSQRKSMDEFHVDHARFRVSASKFKEMTGLIVYGGNYEKPGIQKAWITQTVQYRILAYSSQYGVSNRKPKSKQVSKSNTIAKLEAIRSGKTIVLKGVKPLRRKKR